MNCKSTTYNKPAIPKGTRRFYGPRFSLCTDYQWFILYTEAYVVLRSGAYCGCNTVQKGTFRWV